MSLCFRPQRDFKRRRSAQSGESFWQRWDRGGSEHFGAGGGVLPCRLWFLGGGKAPFSVRRRGFGVGCCSVTRALARLRGFVSPSPYSFLAGVSVTPVLISGNKADGAVFLQPRWCWESEATSRTADIEAFSDCRLCGGCSGTSSARTGETVEAMSVSEPPGEISFLRNRVGPPLDRLRFFAISSVPPPIRPRQSATPRRPRRPGRIFRALRSLSLAAAARAFPPFFCGTSGVSSYFPRGDAAGQLSKLECCFG